MKILFAKGLEEHIDMPAISGVAVIVNQPPPVSPSPGKTVEHRRIRYDLIDSSSFETKQYDGKTTYHEVSFKVQLRVDTCLNVVLELFVNGQAD